MKSKKVTLKDLLDAESKSRGYGLYGHEARTPHFWKVSDPYLMVKAVDEAVVCLANKRRWDAQAVFNFMDSKWGRWAGDELSGVNSVKDITIVLEKYFIDFEKALHE